MADISQETNNLNINDSAALNFLGTMKLYPFNGRSKYLIDKFYIIGYDYPTLKKILIKNDLDFIKNLEKKNDEEQTEKLKINQLPQEFQLQEPPSLINEISSDYSKEVLDIDIIIEMIFPNKPKFYYVEEDSSIIEEANHCNSSKKIINFKEEMEKRAKTNSKEDNSNIYMSSIINTGKNKISNDTNFNINSNNKYENEIKDSENDEYIPNSYNVIFSSNPQSGGNSKKSINGFAHIFYKKFNEKKKNNDITYSFYIPIVFCIISEFPYYNSYYKLTRQIMLLFKSKIIEVPIEFTIQNILNFTLSPINDEVILNITPKNLIELWNNSSNNIINSIEEVEEEKEKENDKNKEIKPFTIDETANEDNKSKKTVSPNTIKNTNDKKIQGKNDTNHLKKEKPERLKSPLTHRSLKPKLNFTKTSYNVRYSFKDKKSLKSTSDLLYRLSGNTNNSSFPFTSKFSNKEEEANIKFEPIIFQFLPGYPLIQYNLAKVLLDILTPYDVIIIFIYTFLEKDVIFFSSNLELLSLTMNSYQNLNFPLNDEKYYFINACVSYDNYIKGNSTFVGSAFTTMVGINDQYQSKYINSSAHKLKDHICIDLDNGNVHQIKDPNNKDLTTRNKFLFDLIKKICKGKEEKESKTILSREIQALNNDLTQCKEKILNYNYSIIHYNSKIQEINQQIQESFYRFINNICIYFYQNLRITISTEGLKNSETVRTELEFDGTYSFQENYTKEEKYFLDELKDTMKFESFIYGFIQSYNPIDLYKIPLTFTEEFVSILSRKSGMQLKNIKFLSLIDNLYHKYQNGRNDIDFFPFMLKYIEKYRRKFDRDIQDYYTSNKEYKNKFNLFDFLGDKKAFNFKYIWYELDNNLIIKYIDLLKNLDPEEYNHLFHFQLFNLENNKIRDVLVSDIENEIEKYAIEANFLSKSDICCGNILLLFTLTLKSFRSSVDTQSFLSTLFHDFIIFRKYYTIVMNMVYKLMEECIKKKDYSHAQNFLFCYYPCINSINENRLVPNENLMNTIKKFNSIDIDTLSEKAQNDKVQGINNTPSGSDSKKFIKKTLNEKNLYVCYNFIRSGTVSEESIVNDINNNEKKYKEKFDKNAMPKIKFRMGKNIIESEIFPQTKILEMLTKEYNLFNKDLDTSKINSKILIDASMNIFLFTRNDNELKVKSEVVDILYTIFYIYYDKYCQEQKIVNKEEEEKKGINNIKGEDKEEKKPNEK